MKEILEMTGSDGKTILKYTISDRTISDPKERNAIIKSFRDEKPEINNVIIFDEKPLGYEEVIIPRDKVKAGDVVLLTWLREANLIDSSYFEQIYIILSFEGGKANG